MGCATGRFGKNHLGDLNQFLPTVDGFDQFWALPTWPDGGMTPFAQAKGTVLEGGFRVPTILRWPGKTPAGKVENGIISRLDWFPTFIAAAGNPNIIEELKRGKKLGDTTYKVHLARHRRRHGCRRAIGCTSNSRACRNQGDCVKR